MKKNVFFSYAFKDNLVIEYYYSMFSKYASKYLNIFFYDKIYHEGMWDERIKSEINQTEVFVFFLSDKIGETQQKEIEYWQEVLDYELLNPKDGDHLIIRNSILVYLVDKSKSADRPEVRNEFVKFSKGDIIFESDINRELDKYLSFTELYFKITGKRFTYPDGLPSSSQVFNYEKDIIDFYRNKYCIEEKLKTATPKTIFSDEERGQIENIAKKLAQGVSSTWPKVKVNDRISNNSFQQIENPILKKIGSARKSQVFAAALTKYHESNSRIHDNFDTIKSTNESTKNHSLSFPEAGPREKIYKPIFSLQYPKYKVGILVSGGIAPGINSVIDGITQRHFEYAASCGYKDKIEVLGLKNGFKFFNNIDDYVRLFPSQMERGNEQNSLVTSEIVNVGGSMIGTSRYELLAIESDSRMKKLTHIIQELKDLKINILYVIGGEGSMKAAHALSTIYEKKYPKNNDWRFNIIGIPKTMDNDILWVWQTFGFMSAVEKAREFIDYLAVETSSNPRVGIVQLFGSNSGFVVSHAVLASRTGVCDFALIPESNYTLEKLIEKLKELLKSKNFGLIIMSETAIPLDAEKYLDIYKILINLTEIELEALNNYFKDKRRIHGHIYDKLRDASFKIVKIAIEEGINKDEKTEYEEKEDKRKFRVLSNEPRHLIRAIPPSTIDIINASRLGTLAVDNAIAGYTDCMISQWLTEYCLIPLDLVVLGRKRIPKDGIFWKSVISKTGQDEILYDPKKYDEDGNKLS